MSIVLLVHFSVRKSLQMTSKFIKKKLRAYACLFDRFYFVYLEILFLVLVDAAAVDNNTRISPDNNLDFYAYSQGTPYSVNSCFYFVFRCMCIYRCNN